MRFLDSYFVWCVEKLQRTALLSFERFRHSRPLLITTCTDRKTLVPPRSLRLVTCRAVRESRFYRVDQPYLEGGTAKVPAFHLYAGEHWSLTKDCAPYVGGIGGISTGYA